MSAFDFNEGVRYATKLIEDACHQPDAFTLNGAVPTVLENVKSALGNKPADFAKGVQSVVQLAADFLKQKGNVTRATKL